MPETSENTRCVVLAAPGHGRAGGLGEELAGRLRRRGWDTVVFSDPCLAMAELCLEDRTQSARTAWGLRPSRQLAIAIAPAPDTADSTERLVAAVHSYLPHVEVWLSDGRELVPVFGEGNPNTPAAVEPEAPHEPRESREPSGPSGFAESSGDQAADDTELAPVEITREEIDMLFAGDLSRSDETREP